MAQRAQTGKLGASAPFTSGHGALALLTTDGFEDYRLLDSGGGRKLERFGRVVVDRPEPQAVWTRARPPAEWERAHAVFSGADEEESGRWRHNRPVPESWPVRLDGVVLDCRLSAFRHLGLFPEQRPHWSWMVERLGRPGGARAEGARPRVLNLFAYTGAASLLAAAAGAEVTHVDASKKAIAWARENQSLSGLGDAPIRWILDDARKFVAREVRRERRYDVILIDPPKFGRGPNGETWDLFEHLGELMRACGLLLAHRGSMVLTAYAIRASAIMLGQMTLEAMGNRPGSLECGELAIREESGGRLVPTSIFARWSGDDGEA